MENLFNLIHSLKQQHLFLSHNSSLQSSQNLNNKCSKNK